MKNYDQSVDDSYMVYSSIEMEFGAVAVETDSLDNDCDQLQGDLEFYPIYHTGDTDNFDDDYVSGFCGQDVDIVSESKVKMTNNN